MLYHKAYNNLDTEEGYKAYHEFENYIKSNNLDDAILYDLAAEFKWDSELGRAVERLEAEESRF